MTRFVPAVTWLRGYDRNWLRSDAVAGTTAAAVVIPQAMGYATVAGLPVQVGLYTCIVPMIVYAVLGGSRRLSFSTTSTIVALTALALSSTGADGEDALAAVATLTLLVGLGLVAFGVLRLGWLVEAVSDAVVTGLKVGVALTIIAAQLPKLLGISPADGGFADDIGNAVSHLGSAHVTTTLIGLGSIIGLLMLRRWRPLLPGPLVALAVGVGLTWLVGLDDRGVELVPEVPSGLPLPALPSLDHVGVLLPYGLVIALMAYFESVTAARISRDLNDPPLDNNQEYTAVGAATLAGAFFQTVPPAGGFSQTQVNTSAGARTQLSELVTAAWAIAIALFLAPLLSRLPEATLGAIVVVSVAGLISVPAFSRLWRIDRIEVVVAAVTAFSALAFNLLAGTLVGVAFTYYLVLRTLNHPVVVELRRSQATGEILPARTGDQSVPGMLILRIEGGLYTLNVRRVQSEIYARATGNQATPQVLVLDIGGTTDTSVTVLDVIAETAAQLGRDGIELWVAAIPTRALAKAQRTPAWTQWADQGRLHRTVTEAVAMYQRR